MRAINDAEVAPFDDDDDDDVDEFFDDDDDDDDDGGASGKLEEDEVVVEVDVDVRSVTDVVVASDNCAAFC